MAVWIKMFARTWCLTNKIRGGRLFSHVPVMAKEIVEVLKPDDGHVFIDMTFGSGGHTRSLLDTNKSIKVIAVDRDPVAYRKAQELATQVAIKSKRLNINQNVIPIHGRFSKVMREIHLSGVPYGSVRGVIFDLGASSMQYDNPERGFAISAYGPLDMRMDTSNTSDITAEDVINSLSQEKLGVLFRTFGEERRSRKIANAIVDARVLLGRIKTTQELARIVLSCSGGEHLDSLGRFAHPATRVFQALRIFVNNELNEINYAIEKIREFLIKAEDETQSSAGLAAVLTFHSLEDRIVKRHFTGIDVNEPIVKKLSQHDRIRTNTVTSIEDIKRDENSKKWKQILKHVQKPTDDEIMANPRSRSAKLRVAKRLL